MPESRLIGVAGLVTWLMVGLPAVLYHTQWGPSDWRAPKNAATNSATLLPPLAFVWSSDGRGQPRACPNRETPARYR